MDPRLRSPKGIAYVVFGSAEEKVRGGGRGGAAQDSAGQGRVVVRTRRFLTAFSTLVCVGSTHVHICCCCCEAVTPSLLWRARSTKKTQPAVQASGRSTGVDHVPVRPARPLAYTLSVLPR